MMMMLVTTMLPMIMMMIGVLVISWIMKMCQQPM